MHNTFTLYCILHSNLQTHINTKLKQILCSLRQSHTNQQSYLLYKHILLQIESPMYIYWVWRPKTKCVEPELYPKDLTFFWAANKPKCRIYSLQPYVPLYTEWFYTFFLPALHASLITFSSSPLLFACSQALYIWFLHTFPMRLKSLIHFLLPLFYILWIIFISYVATAFVVNCGVAPSETIYVCVGKMCVLGALRRGFFYAWRRPMAWSQFSALAELQTL